MSLQRNRKPGSFLAKLISGAVADTPCGSVVHRIICTVAGAASSTVTLRDSSTTGDILFTKVGTAVFNEELNIWCPNGAHVVTVDSGGAMRATIAYI